MALFVIQAIFLRAYFHQSKPWFEFEHEKNEKKMSCWFAGRLFWEKIWGRVTKTMFVNLGVILILRKYLLYILIAFIFDRCHRSYTLW